MAITLDTLVNDYGTYQGNTLIGERGARATIPNKGFDGVQGVPYNNLTFIIEIDGKQYASSQWLSTQKNTPYQDKKTIAGSGMRFTSDMFKLSTSEASILLDSEIFSEMTITSNLNDSTDKILQHIDWLVSDGDSLRTVTDYGSWEVNLYKTAAATSQITDPLGNPYTIGVTGPKGHTYNAELDFGGSYPGLEFTPIPFNGSIGGSEALSQNTNVIEPELTEIIVDEDTNIGNILDTLVLDDFVFDFDIGPIDIGRGSSLGGGFIFNEPIDNLGLEFGNNRGNGSGFTFDGQDTLRIADSLEGFRY